MSLTGEPTTEPVRNVGRQAGAVFNTDSAFAAFRFVPQELVAKCRGLLESYHAMYGFGGLPDMLWQSDARQIIQCHGELTNFFKNTSKSRYAKRANGSLLLIAALVVSIEVLARDFAGWGTRFPAAKREAEKLLGDVPLQPRVWLTDFYLYPPLGMRREFASALALSAATGPARN